MPTKTDENTDLEYDLEYDIDDFLDNDENNHFRNVHPECSNHMLPKGTIMEANCGKLYRTKGIARSISFDTDCLSCLQLYATKSCPVCGKQFKLNQ